MSFLLFFYQIIGPSGSGKTSLLSAILKEMIQTSGIRELDSIENYSKYSVLPQNPWLLNASGYNYFLDVLFNIHLTFSYCSEGQHTVWSTI